MSANPIDELLADYDAGKLNAQSFVQGVRAIHGLAALQQQGQAVAWWNPDCEFGEPFSNVQTKRHTVPRYAAPPSATVGVEDIPDAAVEALLSALYSRIGSVWRRGTRNADFDDAKNILRGIAHHWPALATQNQEPTT